MLKELHLVSKMRLAVDPAKTVFSERHINFYEKYSSFVLKTLKRTSFQKFLRWMLTKENIDEQMISAVYVKIFPLRRKNGKGLAGNCDTVRGKIQVYPRTMKFCTTFAQKFGKNTLLLYARDRARAALIHELLHLKYAADEEKVRELTKAYFFAFTQNQFAHSSHPLCTYMMIFNMQTIKVTEEPRG